MRFSPVWARRVLTGICLTLAIFAFWFFWAGVPFADEGDSQSAALVQKLQQTLSNLREKKQERYALQEKEKQHRILLEQEIDSLSAEREELLTRCDSLKNENSVLQKERDSLAKSLSESESGFERVQLSLKESFRKLAQKIERGLPYRTDERKKVIADFEESAGKDIASDVALFWQILMQEFELGISSEIYPGEVRLPDGRIKEGEYLRIGRLVLAYLTDDGLDCGLIARREGRFEILSELDSSQRAAIKESFQIMRRMRSPALVIFPLRTNVTAQEVDR